VGGRLLLAFAIGAAGMVLGGFVSAMLLRPPPAAAACLCASYVGGSLNFLATAQVG
jgi:uncharacterized membrane protein